MTIVIPASLAATFGNEVTTNTDVPTVYGDGTTALQFSTGSTTEGAIARYGDRLVMAKTTSPDGIAEMLGAFDSALLDFIDENPTCATLHPKTR